MDDFYDWFEEVDENTEYYDNDYDDYDSNMYCDNTGYCCGSSCPNFVNCKGG